LSGKGTSPRGSLSKWALRNDGDASDLLTFQHYDSANHRALPKTRQIGRRADIAKGRTRGKG